MRRNQLTAVLVFTFSLGVAGLTPCAAAETDLPSTDNSETGGRATRGLIAFYDFDEGQGRLVHDRSAAGKPFDLKIEDPRAVVWRPGALEVRQSTIIRSNEPTIRIAEMIRRTREITIEAWVAPATSDQSGPARIVTLSRNGTSRNFTLGQDGSRYDVRFRTVETSGNGLPSLSSSADSLTPTMTHVVYTRSRQNEARIYLNGKLDNERELPGDTYNWDSTFRIALANEQDKTRTWKGTYHLVALYSRDLTPEEVLRNFQAGPGATTAVAQRSQRDPREVHFELNIAPLLSDKCLECHDTASREGGLDLSRKRTALQGGDSGSAVVPGDPEASLVWSSVEADDMPFERPPLNDAEKQLIQEWIRDGATWSLQRIDPAVYVHGGHASENWVRRLTVPEYVATIQATLGVDIAEEAAEYLPPDLRADGFSNTAYNLSVDLKHVDAYGKLAEIIVEKLDIREFTKRFTKSIKFTDKDMGKLISNMGKWVLRGPVSERELIAFRGISTSVAASGGAYDEAVGLILEAMLQSPRFLYRMEDQRGDGSELPLSDYELASRISYIIWGASPDKQLLELVESGEILDEAKLRAHVDTMLDDPRAVAQSRRFLTEWLNLGRLKNLQPNKQSFPKWDGALAEDMRQETLAVFEELVWKQERPLADILNADFTFVTRRLAEHYGLQDIGQHKDPDEVVRVDLSGVPSRGGILTHGSLLTAGGDHASMVTRGLLVMHELLRGVVKAPPPCVDTTPVPTKPGLTQRGIAEQRIADANCGGCHSRFEPLAFGLERFDGLGSFHERDEHGNPLREDGEILVPGTAEPVEYESVSELMGLLAGSERVRETITWKLTQFAMGRPLTAPDAVHVAKIHRQAQAGGGTYKSLMTAIVMSDLVQTIQTNPPTSP